MAVDIYNLRDDQYNNNSGSDIKMVEINPIESCNRRCSFCPRSDSKKYPNTKNKISFETCKNISNQLKSINFTGWVSFVGFGEPLLHSSLEECINIIRQNNPSIKFEVNTNGDFLTTNKIESLYRCGCTNITVSMYDNDISYNINELKGDIPINIVFRHHYDKNLNYNLNLINRSNITYGNTILNLNSPCYLPFYKLMIDWNGDILPCANDWSRTIRFGNINTQNIKEIINGDISVKFKTSLCTGTRIQMPCSKCNACGTIRGEKEFNNFKQNYRL
jgi:radical SAM protein with 4Fe4S-binding SPASM domain